MKHYVYKITNKINNKIYIGKHSTNDKNDGYMGSGKILQRALQKYGIDNFEKTILFEYENEEEALLMESELVDEEFVARLDTYNIQLGGKGSWGYINSSEKKERYLQMAWDRLRELQSDEEWKKEKSEKIKRGHEFYKNMAGKKAYWWSSGPTHTEETKKRIGRLNSKHQKGTNNSQYGTCWIYSEKEKRSMKIDKMKLEIWEDSGWIKGRKIKFE